MMQKNRIEIAEAITQADKAYNIMRESIIEGRLLPGQKLSRREMARMTGVSVIPVIEALHRLEHDGLVVSQAHWGSAVVRFDEEQFRSYAILREAIECQVARELCGKLSNFDALRLSEMADELDAHLYRESDRPEREMRELHYQFHLQMAELTGCAPLIGTLRKINLFNFLMQVVERNSDSHQKKSLPDNWHRSLVDVLVDGDIDAAEDLFRAHVRSSVHSVSSVNSSVISSIISSINSSVISSVNSVEKTEKENNS